MPKYLSNDSIRLLEASLDFYIVAQLTSSFPDLRIRRAPETQYAITMGLLGSCVELLAKACLVQAKGSEMVKRNGFYKYGKEIIDEFKKGIQENDKDFSFLWEKIDEPDIFQDNIKDFLSKSRFLQDLRAHGFHAGKGPSRDVTVQCLNDIYAFIIGLRDCKRLKAYLSNIPTPIQPIISRGALIEDLARRLSAANELKEKAELLRAMYLVLPYIPDEAPEWLQAFDRISVTPEENDVEYLINTLQDAHKIHLYRQRGNGSGLAFVIDKNASAPGDH